MENGESRREDQLARAEDQPERESGRDETEEERLDRNLAELLQELRVALPGVQVLFAFLLAVPFQQNFETITPFQKGAYFGTLICTAISAVMLISPTAYHRITFRYQQKRRLVYYSNRFSIIGLGFLALAMTGAIMLITDYLFGGVATVLMVAATVLVIGFFWFGLPLRRRLKLSAGQEPLEMPEDE
jgi:membrane-associated HD superfamily phosphohydrolase